MTASYQTSFFSSIDNGNNICRNSRRSTRSPRRLFQVDVEDFDHEVESYEIEADSASEAAEIAESRFLGDVYNMNIYEIRF